MGLNINEFNNKSIIDTQALTRVTEQILNPDKQTAVDVSTLDLSKFNRVSLGTDLYSARTNTETAIQTSKAATDFDVNLSKSFSANIQYLNSAAAQSLFSSKETTGRVVIPVETAQQTEISQAVLPSSNVNETSNLNKNKRGSNPFAFFGNTNEKEDEDDLEAIYSNPFSGLNIFA